MEFDEPDLKLVCRSFYCSNDWKECEWVSCCPHSFKKNEDVEFSINAFKATCDYLSGKFRCKCDAARAHGISIHNFYLYRKACGYIGENYG